MKGCRVPFQMWKLYENRSSFKSTVNAENYTFQYHNHHYIIEYHSFCLAVMFMIISSLSTLSPGCGQFSIQYDVLSLVNMFSTTWGDHHHLKHRHHHHHHHHENNFIFITTIITIIIIVIIKTLLFSSTAPSLSWLPADQWSHFELCVEE